MVTREYVTLAGLALMLTLSAGCSQVVNVYWTKPGAGKAQLQEDVEECQSLQRRVGLNEARIEQCLEAQGWSPVRQEPMEEELEPEPDIQDSESEE